MSANKVRGALLVFLGASSFGILSTIVKKAYAQGYSPGEVTGIQAFLGALILWLLVFAFSVFRQNKGTNAGKGAWWQIILAGTSSGAVSVLYYKCVQLLPASIAIILLMQYLWMSILLEYVVSRKKPSRIQFIAAVLVLAGTIFASGLVSRGAESLNWAGIAYGLAAAAAYAVFLFVNGKVGNNFAAVTKSALMVTGACILVFSVFTPTFIYNGRLFSELFLWGVPLALFGTVIPPLFFAYGIPKAGITTSAILSSVELPVAVLMSYLVLREQVDVLQWTGVLIILASIVLARKYK